MYRAAVLLILILCRFGIPGWTPTSMAQELPSLRLELDDSVYAVHQPIVAILSAGGTAERRCEIPSLRVDDGFVGIYLTTSTGQAVRRTVEECRIGVVTGPPATIPVEPGHWQVEVENLLSLYGSFVDSGSPIALSYGQFVLGPGEYQVTATLRMPRVNGTAAPILRSQTLRFRIAPPETFGQETDALNAFVRKAAFPSIPAFLSPEGRRLEILCGQSIRQFFRSRYLMLLYYASNLPNDETPTEALVREMSQADVSEIRRAAIFWSECKVARKKGDEKAAWLRGMHGPWLTGRVEEVRETWLKRAELHRFDPASSLVD